MPAAKGESRALPGEGHTQVSLRSKVKELAQGKIGILSRKVKGIKILPMEF